MILPKGTMEFERTGGEDAIEDVMGRIKSGTLTGYMLVLGKVDSSDGDPEEITGQLVFKEGGAVLCESVVNNKSRKGMEGIYPILKSMLVNESNIQFKSKIDVEPPIAFFKECKVNDESLDISQFLDNVRKEEEEKQRIEEEKKKREKKKKEIQKKAEDWITSGYMITSFPEIMHKDFEDIEQWYDDISEKIERVKGYTQWLRDIEEIEVDKEREELMELMKKPEDIMVIESAKTKFQETLDGITEKRQEILKWVNLWKDEGYNTLNIEERMKDDLNTAWNAMAEFMDHIQHLKEAKEDLENIKKEPDVEGYGSEIREIDFLLNDPDEIENINRLLADLKGTILEEKKAKEEILTMAKEIESQGYDISSMMEALKERLHDFREHFNLLMNNTMRITEIREELNIMDRKDIPEEIDNFKENTKDPMKLDEYEESIIQLKDRLEGFRTAREEITSEIRSLEDEGFILKGLDEKMKSPLEHLKAFKDDFKSKVIELKGLKENISQMDHRWLEEDFQEVESKLNDPSMIDIIRDGIGRIQEKIDIREKKRQQVTEEMNGWEGEGFIVTRLKDVIGEKMEDFTTIHGEMAEKISRAREFLGGIKNLDIRYFKQRAADLKTRLMDPFDIEGASKDFEDFSEDVTMDLEKRKTLTKRMEELEGDNWSFEGMDDIINEQPENLQKRIDVMEENVSRLIGSFKDIETWDPLEMKLLTDGIEEMKTHLYKISDADNAISHFTDIKDKIISNKEMRESIKNTLAEWKDVGYIIRSASELQDDEIEKLSGTYDELKTSIEGLETIQEEFDSLNTKHFPKEAEDIEFKLNDPGLLDEIRSNMVDLKEKITADISKRNEFRERIEDYTDQGFMGAEKLREFLDEDLSIVDLEFKNFAKEVDLFRKYMEKVGFIFKVKEEAKKGKE